MKSSFVMLAQTYNSEKHRIAGMFASEKLDGIRAIWDGGITRGMACQDVPFANTRKHARFKVAPIATGLWTRYAQPINAPNWFLDTLPPICLDGELWTSRGNWQEATSIVKSTVNSDREAWKKVRYSIFDAPSIYDLFQDRDIEETNISITLDQCIQWVLEQAESMKLFIPHLADGIDWFHPSWTLAEADRIIQPKLDEIPYVSWLQWHPQTLLSKIEEEAKAFVDYKLQLITEMKGEGVMLRSAHSIWKPERSWNLLKVKPRLDAEATVIGYIWGRRTGKGSKLLGKMGAMICRMDNGVEFELSGFTNAERELLQDLKKNGNPEQFLVDSQQSQGEKCANYITSAHFPIGSRVTFKYRELSNSGVPKEAAYWRKA